MFIEFLTAHGVPYIFNKREIKLVIPQRSGNDAPVRIVIENTSYVLHSQHTYLQVLQALVAPSAQFAEPGDEVPVPTPAPARKPSAKARRAR